MAALTRRSGALPAARRLARARRWPSEDRVRSRSQCARHPSALAIAWTSARGPIRNVSNAAPCRTAIDCEPQRQLSAVDNWSVESAGKMSSSLPGARNMVWRSTAQSDSPACSAYQRVHVQLRGGRHAIRTRPPSTDRTVGGSSRAPTGLSLLVGRDRTGSLPARQEKKIAQRRHKMRMSRGTLGGAILLSILAVLGASNVVLGAAHAEPVARIR